MLQIHTHKSHLSSPYLTYRKNLASLPWSCRQVVDVSSHKFNGFLDLHVNKSPKDKSVEKAFFWVKYCAEMLKYDGASLYYHGDTNERPPYFLTKRLWGVDLHTINSTLKKQRKVFGRKLTLLITHFLAKSFFHAQMTSQLPMPGVLLVHGNLKMENIILGYNGQVSPLYHGCNGFCHTPEELYENEQNAVRLNLFSFAVLMTEMYAGQSLLSMVSLKDQLQYYNKHRTAVKDYILKLFPAELFTLVYALFEGTISGYQDLMEHQIALLDQYGVTPHKRRLKDFMTHHFQETQKDDIVSLSKLIPQKQILHTRVQSHVLQLIHSITRDRSF